MTIDAASRERERALSRQPTLRERQRARVREDIREAAYTLLSERGDDVSVGDISELAGVSERTFYRYFATREDAMLAWIDAVATVVHARLREHRPGESTCTALQEAFIASMDSLESSKRASAMRMVYSSPRLLNAYSEHQRRWEQGVSEVLAERLGTSTETDPRPELWTSIAFAIAVRVTTRHMATGGREDQRDLLRQAYRQAADLFE